MAKITRKTQKIFGGDYILDGAQTEIAVFGSKKDGAPAYSVDPDAIQSANYSQGWNDAVLTSLDGLKKMPLLQDSNALFYVLSRNLAYLNQAGIAEYDSNTVYYINDICRDVGTTNIYKSITDDNTGNVLTDSVNWEFLSDLRGQPVGSIIIHGSDIPPDGYLEANGSNISRIVYANLFSIYGETYGVGDGSTTFGIPDLRGEFIRGWDNGRGIDVGRVFGSAQGDEFRSHSHGGGMDNVQNLIGGGAGAFVHLNTQPLPDTGLAGGAETRPRNVALIYCIKY